MSEYQTKTLGIKNMPEGYTLHRLDSGHWMWVEDKTDRESCIHWNRWAVWKGAVLDSRGRT